MGLLILSYLQLNWELRQNSFSTQMVKLEQLSFLLLSQELLRSTAQLVTSIEKTLLYMTGLEMPSTRTPRLSGMTERRSSFKAQTRTTKVSTNGAHLE